MKIKLQQRNPEKFDTIELYEAMSRQLGYSLGNEDDINKFAEKIRGAVSTSITDTMVYGKRVESLFAYMAASLGNCEIIKKEDSGTIFSKENIFIPDYRIILNNNNQLLIEVKNYYQKEPFSSYTISKTVFDGLINYSKAMDTPLMIAIFWSKWNYWTLVEPKCFRENRKKMYISYKDAVLYNNMFILGDALIGTTPKLSLKIHAKQEERNIIKNNQAYFTIGDISFYCDGKIINDDNDKKIVLGLILYGDWIETNVIETVDDNDSKIDYIKFEYLPEEYDTKNNYAIIGTLSSIISKQYMDLTNKDGKIQRMSPNQQIENLGIMIPKPYIKKDLPLWIFTLKPKEEEK